MHLRVKSAPSAVFKGQVQPTHRIRGQLEGDNMPQPYRNGPGNDPGIVGGKHIPKTLRFQDTANFGQVFVLLVF